MRPSRGERKCLLKLRQQGDLADGRRRDPLVFRLEPVRRAPYKQNGPCPSLQLESRERIHYCMETQRSKRFAGPDRLQGVDGAVAAPVLSLIDDPVPPPEALMPDFHCHPS